ncbi:MAG: hypothetical protein JWP97_4717 [Labilithrix sp.]|nr:hypothetical protein [Labilithrix sp.]
MPIMRLPSLAVLVPLGMLAVGTSGCAHGRERRAARAVPDAEVAADPEVIVSEPPAPADEARGRPRLSRTVTLGQSSGEAVYSGGAPAAPPGGSGGPAVVVNNNVIVNGAAGGYYGGYYGGGYYGSGVPYGMRDAAPRGATNAWAPTGWEGAGRTAAPGQTPHVGGNWSPPPSSGPRAMR